jgi:4,5-DOPA dioxygenase extradiol
MPDPYDWAIRFETEARQMMLAGEFKGLVTYERVGREVWLSIPTPDHCLPLLYATASSSASGSAACE